MSWLAIDVGGAHLKVSDGASYARSRAFPLWQRPDDLEHELRFAMAEAPASDHLAVTMTGELADCFATKHDGVQHIIAAVQSAADGRHTRIYSLDGRFMTPAAAARAPEAVAAANWHALAQFARRYAAGRSLLVDVGSTTTDIVGLDEQQVLARGRDDTERLLAGELLYTGVERTPVCAVVRSVPYRDQQCPVAAEVFATMRDVYLILGKLPEAARDTHTADGRPATKTNARARLGRMICADPQQFHHRDAAAMAEYVAATQVELLGEALRAAIAELVQPATVITSGAGEFLAHRALRTMPSESQVVSLHQQLDAAASTCAPAYALAVLAREGRGT